MEKPLQFIMEAGDLVFLKTALTLPSPPRRGFCGIQPRARLKPLVLLHILNILILLFNEFSVPLVEIPGPLHFAVF